MIYISKNKHMLYCALNFALYYVLYYVLNMMYVYII